MLRRAPSTCRAFQPLPSTRIPAARGIMLPGGPVLIVRVCLSRRLVSGNSIEEKLLKNGTKDLIREVAAQGNDYSMAFLTQVPVTGVWSSRLPPGDGARGFTTDG